MSQKNPPNQFNWWGGGIMPAMSCNGMEAVVPLSNRTMYDSSEHLSSEGNGMSMTVPARSIDQCAQPEYQVGTSLRKKSYWSPKED